MPTKRQLVELAITKIVRKIIKEMYDPEQTAKISVNDGKYTDVWYISKTGDSTHLEVVNDEKYIGTGGMSVTHINQCRNTPWHDDVRSWLRGGQSPDSKVYQK